MILGLREDINVNKVNGGSLSTVQEVPIPAKRKAFENSRSSLGSPCSGGSESTSDQQPNHNLLQFVSQYALKLTDARDALCIADYNSCN